MMGSHKVVKKGFRAFKCQYINVKNTPAVRILTSVKIQKYYQINAAESDNQEKLYFI